MPSAKSIAAAIEAIPAKKENLKRAFDELQAHASSLSSFSLQWKDLEDHISSAQRSIEERFRDLQAKEREFPSQAMSFLSPAEMDKPALEEELDPRPELKALCSKMNGKGLLRFIIDNRKDLAKIRKELNKAIQVAADPAKMVLEAIGGFYPSTGLGPSGAELHFQRRTCILLLERLHVISPEIKAPVREKAKKLAVGWKEKISPDRAQGNVEILAFMQLLASYGVMSEFEADDLLDLLVPIARRKQALDFCRDFGLADKMPEFIEKLSSKGRQIDAVKFVYAFELVDKFPPVQLLREFVKASKKVAQDVRKRGNNSTQSKNEAIAKEVAALSAVIKTIEEHKLESEYSPDGLQKRIAQLEQQKPEKKRSAAGAAPQNLKGQLKQRETIKRARLSAATSAVAAAPHLQTQLQQSLVDRVPLGSVGSYGLSGNNYLHDLTSATYAANSLGLGTARSPSRSYLYSDPLAGSGLYDRTVAYGSYLSGGMPPQYGSSLYR